MPPAPATPARSPSNVRAILRPLCLTVAMAAAGCLPAPRPPDPARVDATRVDRNAEATIAGTPATPLAIGETFTLHSRVLGETRRVNVYAPPDPAGDAAAARPVLYLLDGGIREDFLHVAGLVQVLVGNGTMRPFLVVGIENTERRRDLTGPTTVAEDRRIAPRVGESARFREFLRRELVPAVATRYRTTAERALVGESLAGLFVVETLLRDPTLFDTYVAVDPSLWWDGERLVGEVGEALRADRLRGRTLLVASSGEPGMTALAARLAGTVAASDPGAQLGWHLLTLPDESHATVFHPAALRAFRRLLAPAPASAPGAR